MVRAHVGDQRGLVGRVAHATQHQAAPRGLQDRHVHVVAAEHPARALGAGQVALLHDPVADDHAVRRREAHPAATGTQDGADHAGRGGLAVRAADADDRDVPVGVADPARRVGAGPLDGIERPRQGPAAARAGARHDAALHEHDGSLSDAFRPALLPPRERDDPMPGLGGAMDRHRDAARPPFRDQPAVRAGDPMETPDPLRHRHDGLGCIRRADRRTETDASVRFGHPVAIPGAPTPDGQLDLHGRLQPVQVRPVEQADLHASHRPRRIAAHPTPGQRTPARATHR